MSVMALTFELKDILSVGATLVAGTLAYAELKLGQRDHKRRIEKLEADVEVLQTAAQATGLLKQAVENLTRELRSFEGHLKENTDAQQTLEKSVVQLQTRLEMEHR